MDRDNHTCEHTTHETDIHLQENVIFFQAKSCAHYETDITLYDKHDSFDSRYQENG